MLMYFRYVLYLNWLNFLSDFIYNFQGFRLYESLPQFYQMSIENSPTNILDVPTISKIPSPIS